MPGLVVPMVHILLPYMVLPIYAAVQSIDPNHLRAARSLGASSTLVLRSVVLPALRSGALAGTVIVFILSLGFYVTPAFLGAPGDRVLAIVIGEVFGRQRDLALASAMGVLMLLAVLVALLRLPTGCCASASSGSASRWATCARHCARGWAATATRSR